MNTNQSAIIKDLNLSIYDINYFFGNSDQEKEAVQMIQQAIVLLTSITRNTMANV